MVDEKTAKADTTQAKPAPAEAKSITVTFTGDPRPGKRDPDVASYHGKDFPKGKPVKVEDEVWIKAHHPTLRKNNHFRIG